MYRALGLRRAAAVIGLLALLCQLLVLVLAGPVHAAQSLGAPICHAGSPGPQGRSHNGGPAEPCIACAACSLAARPAILPLPPVAPTIPVTVRAAEWLPPAEPSAGRGRDIGAALPRGPPALLAV